MIIEMLESLAGNGFNLDMGRVYDVPDREAKQYVLTGLAVKSMASGEKVGDRFFPSMQNVKTVKKPAKTVKKGKKIKVVTTVIKR